ncbi:toll/interleukin-1 receptor domain-containing protein [uncultured Thiodictyon sp.]|uniref:toll/interleukin-1 receptor domain-containing protein n=1 Tax=uncultured Thiodictyon sp. TaxID=1846217 RepID=UPI0025D49E7B|nr:toll/interleukin-1 receptor domain-containing protein [uncultured Thiodictyon sp.]
MSDETGADVFLAYSSKDRAWVEQFVSSLKASGVNSWFDIADIPLGEPWEQRLEDALRHSRTLVIILTPNSIRNRWTLVELGAALADGKRIIPVVAEELDTGDTLPFLRGYRTLHEASPAKAGKQVAEAILAAAA